MGNGQIGFESIRHGTPRGARGPRTQKDREKLKRRGPVRIGATRVRPTRRGRRGAYGGGAPQRMAIRGLNPPRASAVCVCVPSSSSFSSSSRRGTPPSLLANSPVYKEPVFIASPPRRGEPRRRSAWSPEKVPPVARCSRTVLVSRV